MDTGFLLQGIALLPDPDRLRVAAALALAAALLGAALPWPRPRVGAPRRQPVVLRRRPGEPEPGRRGLRR